MMLLMLLLQLRITFSDSHLSEKPRKLQKPQIPKP